MAASAAALTLAACGSATGNGDGSPSGTAATIWLVTTGPSPANTAIQNLVFSFEKSHPGDTIAVDFIENQSYKEKIQLAMGAGDPPTAFWTWGGGPLQQFIKAGDVQSLGSSPSWKSSFLASSLDAVTVNGQLYGAPVEGTQPVYFFYNKQVFARYNLTFPKTWSGLLSTIATLRSHGVTPISLANGDQWPGLMYLEYLADRIGGPGVAQALQSDKPGGWSSPAITQALNDIQELARAGAFQSGYPALHYSGGGSDVLVYNGKAAMQLMGDWDISSVLGSDESFVNSGSLGMAPFPTVPGGKGNPADLAGNTAIYLSISSDATTAQKKIVEAFIESALTSTGYAKTEIAAGEVPVTMGAGPLFTGQSSPRTTRPSTAPSSRRRASGIPGTRR